MNNRAALAHATVLALVGSPLSAEELAPAVEYLMQLEAMYARRTLQESLKDGSAAWYSATRTKRGRPSRKVYPMALRRACK